MVSLDRLNVGTLGQNIELVCTIEKKDSHVYVDNTILFHLSTYMFRYFCSGHPEYPSIHVYTPFVLMLI